MAVMAVGFSAVLLLAFGERLLPGRPVALFVVVLSIVVAWAFDLSQFGVVTVGQLPQDFPAWGCPRYVLVRSTASFHSRPPVCCYRISRVYPRRELAAKHGYSLNVRQELLGLGGANLAVALGHGYPVAGGLSQSAVNEKAAPKTPLALLFASATLALSLLFLTGLLRDLPKAVLAAIVLMAVAGLINVRELRRVWRVSRLEFQVAMVALVAVLLLGILKGVLLAAVASILLLLRRTASPHVAFLGRIPGTRRYSDLERNPDNEKIPGVVVFRTEASLLYFNVDNVLRDVLAPVDQEGARRASGGVRSFHLALCRLGRREHAAQIADRTPEAWYPLRHCRSPRARARSTARQGLERRSVRLIASLPWPTSWRTSSNKRQLRGRTQEWHTGS